MYIIHMSYTNNDTFLLQTLCSSRKKRITYFRVFRRRKKNLFNENSKSGVCFSLFVFSRVTFLFLFLLVSCCCCCCYCLGRVFSCFSSLSTLPTETFFFVKFFPFYGDIRGAGCYSFFFLSLKKKFHSDSISFFFVFVFFFRFAR